MRVTYDESADATYIYLVDIDPGEAKRQVAVQLDHGEVVLDLNERGVIVGIEVIGALALLPSGLLEHAERLE